MTFKTAILVALVTAFITGFFWLAHIYFLGLIGNLAQVALIIYVAKFGIKSNNKSPEPPSNPNIT
jgi:hypothetical protein